MQFLCKQLSEGHLSPHSLKPQPQHSCANAENGYLEPVIYPGTVPGTGGDLKTPPFCLSHGSSRLSLIPLPTNPPKIKLLQLPLKGKSGSWFQSHTRAHS